VAGSSRARRIAVYISAHGFGHAVRAAAVLDQLRELLPIRLTVIAACNRRIWPASLDGFTEEWDARACDVGVVQSDDVTVDMQATRATLDRWMSDLPATVERETGRLAGGYDLVIGDVPSPAFTAAERAGIPGVAIANFSWDWIYAELGFEAAAAVTAAGYVKAKLLLECVPFGPMTAFRHRLDVGLVARTPSRARAASRSALGLGIDDSLVLLAFQPASAPALQLPVARPGRTYLVPSGWPEVASRNDVRALPDGMRFEDALSACDVVVGKPGYGLVGDVEATGARFLYVPRPGFPENEVLESHLRPRAGTMSIPAQQLAAGRWEDALASLEAADAPRPADAGGAKRAAREIAAMLGVDSERDTE